MGRINSTYYVYNCITVYLKTQYFEFKVVSTKEAVYVKSDERARSYASQVATGANERHNTTYTNFRTEEQTGSTVLFQIVEVKITCEQLCFQLFQNLVQLCYDFIYKTSSFVINNIFLIISYVNIFVDIEICLEHKSLISYKSYRLKFQFKKKYFFMLNDNF